MTNQDMFDAPTEEVSQSMTTTKTKTGRASSGSSFPLDQLKAQYPGTRDSVLFCAHHLKRDPNMGLNDLKSAAKELGMTLSGRSLGSARELLGLASAKPKAERKPRSSTATYTRSSSNNNAPDTGALSKTIDDVISQMRNQDQSRISELQDAIRTAIDVLQRAATE